MSKQTVTRALALDPRDKNPEATEYHVNATLLMQDVEALKGRPFSAGAYILLIHALEMALKSYLLCNGFTKQQLERNFGHKLSLLYAEAIAKGLNGSDLAAQ